MIIFLYGEDSYRRIKKLNEISELYRKRHGSLSEGRFDLSVPENFFKLKEFMVNRSMFDSSKLAVLDAAFDTGEAKDLKNLLKETLESKDSTIIISSEKKPPADFGFLLKLKEPSKAQEFPALEGVKLTAFIKNEAAKRGLKLQSATLDSLREIFGGDSWGIITELEKLSLLKGESRETGQKSLGNFYELVNSLRSSREVKRKIVLIELLLSGLKEDPAKVFNTLSYRSYGGEMLRLFADYDIAVKSGRLDYEEVLTDFVLL